MDAVAVAADIERLSRLRHDIWLGRADAGEGQVDRIAADLHDLFEEKRKFYAEAGTPERRDRRMAAARIDMKLEDLR